MGQFKDLARQFLAVFPRNTDIKKEKPELNNEVDCCTHCQYHGLEPQTTPKPTSTNPLKNRWNFRPGAEFPWRFEQLVEEEENWRGTWVLEVKDMRAMDSGTIRVPRTDGNGRGGRYERRPTRHLPFPVGEDGHRQALAGGQDDLMVQLGKP